MQEYAIQKSSRRCYVTNRALAPGERYFSAVMQKGGDLVRRDFSDDNWPGPNHETIGWWVSTIPSKTQSGSKLAPTPVLLDTLDSLLSNPDQQALAYILAIQLLRKRILVTVSDTQDSDVESSSILHLRSSSTHAREFHIPVVEVQEPESESIQTQLIELLYSEA